MNNLIIGLVNTLEQAINKKNKYGVKKDQRGLLT